MDFFSRWYFFFKALHMFSVPEPDPLAHSDYRSIQAIRARSDEIWFQLCEDITQSPQKHVWLHNSNFTASSFQKPF